MRYVPIVLAVSIAVFVLSSLGRTIHVDRFEFNQAVTEFNAARERGDRDGMQAAYEKEKIAHCRTFDPFWFSSRWANKCGHRS